MASKNASVSPAARQHDLNNDPLTRYMHQGTFLWGRVIIERLQSNSSRKAEKSTFPELLPLLYTNDIESQCKSHIGVCQNGTDSKKKVPLPMEKPASDSSTSKGSF